MSEWQSKVTLSQVSQDWWQLTNKDGKEISPMMHFTSKLDAVQWAYAWTSSWTSINLVIEDAKED